MENVQLFTAQFELIFLLLPTKVGKKTFVSYEKKSLAYIN